MKCVYRFIVVIVVVNNRVSISALLKQTHELMNDFSASEAREHKTFYILKLFSNIKQERDLTP